MPMRTITLWRSHYAPASKIETKSLFHRRSRPPTSKKVLGVKTDAEVIRLAVERIVEMEKFWQFMEKSRRTLQPGNVEEP
jgi:hypothetical protein